MSVRSANPVVSVARGRTVTSWPGRRNDLRDAGATWVDEQVRAGTDGPDTLIPSRMPADLGAHDDSNDLNAFNDAVPTEMSVRT